MPGDLFELTVKRQGGVWKREGLETAFILGELIRKTERDLAPRGQPSFLWIFTQQLEKGLEASLCFQ